MTKINLSIHVFLLLAILFLYFKFDVRSEKTVYIEPDKVYDNFFMRKQLQAELEKTLERDTRLLDSLTLHSTAEQSKKIEALKFQLHDANTKLADKYDAQIWAQLNQYIIDYGNEENITFILGANGSGAVFYARPDKNVTTDVIEYVNKKYQNK